MNPVEEPLQLTSMERRRLALEKIDNAKFSLYHVRLVPVHFSANRLVLSWLLVSDCMPSIFLCPDTSFTDAYDIFAVNFANVMIGYVYYPTTGALPSSSDTAIKISTSAGTVIGQLGFGFLADHLGRKKVRPAQLGVITSRCTVSNS